MESVCGATHREFESHRLRMREKNKKLLGIVFIILGIVSILTPFTPFGILLFVGLELAGVKLLFIEKIKKWYDKHIAKDRGI